MSNRCRLLEWDSRFFGLRIARLEGNRLRPADVAGIFQWCADEQIDCLYFLADNNCPETIATAEHHGFGCKDHRVTYKWDSGGIHPQVGEKLQVRPHRNADLEALVQIARTAHTDSRFFFDRRFDSALAAKLYEVWIRNACTNHSVLVCEMDGQPAGYLSCQRSGEIGLVAVDARFQGQGVGRSMMDSALGWFGERGISDIRVITQGRNIGAHRFYQRAGFLVQSVECWFHRWFDREL